MTYTASPSPTTVPDMKELQNKMIQSIKHFSEIAKIKVKDNSFIQGKVNQISNQRKEFRNFGEESITHSLKMCTHADDLIIFAECCEDDNISNDDLLEILKPLLSESKLYKAKAKLLKNKLERVRIPLDGIVREIVEYDEEITRKRKDLPDKIDKADKATDAALSRAKDGLLIAGIGATVAIVAAPFTAGASLAIIPVAEAAVGLGAAAVLGGATAAAVSTTVAGGSIITSEVLNYKLKNVREQFSEFLQKMRGGLDNVNDIITECEVHWERQAVEIEDIIKKLERNEDKRLVKPFARSISAKAKKILARSESYSVEMRQALNRDAVLSSDVGKKNLLL